MRRLLALALLTCTLGGGLSACGAKVELPPATSLQASAEDLAAIPGLARGPHAVNKGAARDWAVDGHTLRVRVVSPQGEGPYPLVLFSHGFAADIDGYDALLDHWASHGFVSIAPYHRDGGGSLRAIFNSVRLGNEGLIAARIRDLHLILENLDALDSLEAGLAAKIDRNTLIAAGHSFGAFSAQQLGGAASIDPESGNRISGYDARIRAVVAISPPGEMFGLINAQSWTSLAVPTLMTTGTWDVDGHFVTHWEQHKLSWENAPPGNNWMLVVDGADHYLGNLICRLDRDQAPQRDALQMVNASAVSFMHSITRGDDEAHRLLHSNLLESRTRGFARLSQR